MKNLSLKNKIALKLFQHLINIETELHELRYLFWECTLRCNINCIHCGSDCSQNVRQKDMPLTDFLKVAKQISEKYDSKKIIIVITGGEPLLRNDLETCGIELTKLGFNWGIVTNAFLLNQARLNSLINAGMCSITVSLDGFQDAHNWLRGNLHSFENAVNALKLIVKQNNISHDVVSCINKKNIVELETFCDFLISLGIKRWRIANIFPTGRAENNTDLEINNEQFTYLMNFISKTRQQNKIKTTYSCEGFLGGYEKQVRDDFYVCRAGINIASVLVDGSICACPNINHSFVQGNIYNDDFISVWNNKFETMRNRKWTQKDDCNTCKVYQNCKGNGIHLYKNIESKVAKCHYKMIKSL